MRTAWHIATTVWVVLAPVPLALASPLVLGEATWTQDATTQAAGLISGTCEGRAYFFKEGRGGSIPFHADGGLWRRYVTEFNRTLLQPQSPQPTSWETSRDQSETRHDLAPGEGRLTWGEGAVVRVFAGPGPLRPDAATFRASYTTPKLVVEPFTHDFPGVYYVRRSDAPADDVTGKSIVIIPGGLAGWNRYVDVGSAPVRLDGRLTLYLEEATLELPDSRDELPPHREAFNETPSNSLAQTVHLRFHHAFVTLENAWLEAPGGAGALVCRGVQGRVDGTLAAWGATGRLTSQSRAHEFAEEQLGLQGRFVWADEPSPQVVDGRPPEASGSARGSFAAASIGFIPAELAPAPGAPLLPKVAAWTATLLALAGILYGTAKGALLLFSRIRDDALVEHPARALLATSIASQPGLDLRSLANVTSLHESQARYHLRRLEAGHLVASRRIGRERRFWPHGQRPPEPKRLHSEFDGPVGFLLQWLPAEGARMRDALDAIATAHGLSRPGAFKAVVRAERRGLLRRERRGHGVWLQSA